MYEMLSSVANKLWLLLKNKLLPEFLSSVAGPIDWTVGEVAENCSYGLDLSERETERKKQRM